MKSVFLDFATLGANELDPSPISAALPNIEIFDSTKPELTADRVNDAEFIITNKVHITTNIIKSTETLRYIGVIATGVDNIDLRAAKEQKVVVCNIPAYCTQSVIEHVFAVLLNLTHSIRQYAQSVARGAWQRADSFCLLDYPIRELSAMTIGIVGHGELGSAVARMANTFGMKVMIAERPGSSGKNGGRVSISKILEQADVVSLHCPLTEETRGLIGSRELGTMKPGAILINTARGGLVDSSALVEALANGTIAAAAIDVLQEEPPIDGDPLLEYQGDNLLLTPHIAWGTVEARQNAINEVAANIEAFKNGIDRNRVV